MASRIADSGPRKRSPLAPDTVERLLAGAALVLLAAVGIAIAKGQYQWHLVPPMVWLHIATILIALVLTPVMLLRRRGDRLHRRLGWVWCAALGGSALISFWVRTINPGNLSLIHILSAWTLIQVPLILWSARSHNVKRHRASVRGMVLGALLIAGIFTFPFGRLMGQWLFG
ncbi:MAG TPA: hypothetical protein VHM92_01435 [Allosphingosinicella sp.]|nr:hypothetical protein [Allosphingosinicella sp.]